MAIRWKNAKRRRNNSVKMAAPLATCIKGEQHSDNRFLRSEGEKPIEIHRRMENQLTADFKERRVDGCQELLKRFEAESDGFLGRIVTGDETWVHYHQPETKKARKEWRHTSSPKPKKFRTQPSAGKVTLTLFWNERGVILEHYMPGGTL